MVGRLPIRLRLALFSGLLIAAVIVALGSFVYLRLEADLRASVDDGLAERAQDLIDDPPDGPVIEMEASDIGDVFALIVSGGKVVAATDGAPVANIPSFPEHAGTFEIDVPSDEGPQTVRVLATPSRLGIVYTGVAFDDQRATLDSLRLELLVALPIAVALAMLTGWLVGGAALRPVERMRRETEAISASEPDRRLSVPPTRDELANLGLSLNRMLDRLGEAVERERRLLDNASHELRTPLANLKAELDLALRQPRSGTELLTALRSAADETDRLSLLAADLLVLARVHRGRLPVTLRETDIDALIHHSVHSFNGRAAQAGVAIETSVAPALRANVDEPRVRQALDNLLDNAIRHAGDGGRVTVAGAAQDGSLMLSVADSGAGFSEGFLPQAFEAFSRTDEGRARGDGGAGLGLAIVRAVADAHGGSVSAANRPDGGAIVELRLPL